ncbi:hypothetical protein HETIRDRAFT_165889 [Heterobasidion irregulare TC 32-1]|uniref:Uncharacterized protein n=1 Tax=Heterobasidion irregulare (strain TC 32-1) TaxID=747525 RepID=W4KG81_HETIT|nr:uncharacterized protein HETIRDRAFT_165889 [Heterobasidion irregulare TC 32-1]ETW84863.1 hypothetical protein HETIRDRAFT_165889 [Heterobasidion irregulare TC 32-1]
MHRLGHLQGIWIVWYVPSQTPRNFDWDTNKDICNDIVDLTIGIVEVCGP